jgi:hypothetical protein
MEQLLMRANGLHMEAALLSNTLHEFRDDDIDGARSVIGHIAQKRKEWKQVRQTIDFFQKTGKLPEQKAETSILVPSENKPGVAELKLELSRLNVNISKYQKKINDQPDHKKMEVWKEDLAKMEALKFELKQNIVNLTYAAT